jgi:hypothetical protein
MIALLGLIPFRVWAYGAAIFAIVAGIGIAIHHFESVGAADATAKIERANDASRDAANQEQDKVGKAFDACMASGGVWNRAGLVCNAAPDHSPMRSDH